MWKPKSGDSLMQLDLSRRRVAAISFLSNIPTDNQPTEIRLDCLQGTHVLRDFKRKKEQRRRNQQLLQQQGDQDSGSGSGTTRAKIDRKLTFAKELEEESTLQTNDSKHQPAAARKISKVEVNLLHLGVSHDGTADLLAHTSDGHPHTAIPLSNAGFSFGVISNDKPYGSDDQLLAEQKNAKKRFKSVEDNATNKIQEMFATKPFIGSSNESLGLPGNLQPVSALATRLRKISGNYSDNTSSCSLREIRFFKAPHSTAAATHWATSSVGVTDERNAACVKSYAHSGDRRLVFVTGERRVPFSVSSVIPLSKSSYKGHRRHSVSRMSIRSDHRAEVGAPGVANRGRHHANSFSKPLNTINDGNEIREYTGGIGVNDRGDDPCQDTSYNHLLTPIPLAVFFGPDLGGHHFANPQLDEAADDHKGGAKRLQHGSGDNSSAIQFSSSPNLDFDLGSSGDIRHCSSVATYSPRTLDGWLIAGKHRTLLPFPSYVTSVIEYVKPHDLKRELNAKFRERFPHLNISLTKLRSIKREMKKIALTTPTAACTNQHSGTKSGSQSGIDLLTLAMAYVYFEVLVLKAAVNKINRKMCAGSCLILAAKLNDIKGLTLKGLIERIENVFRIGRKDLLASEFSVLVSLEFSLHVPTWQIYPHYQRLLHEV